MSNRNYNITLIIVLIIFALASVGINYIASGIGLPDGVTDTIGFFGFAGLVVLYIFYRQKEGKETAELKEKVARLEERNKKADYYKEQYEYYYKKWRDLYRERESSNGKET